MGVADFWVLLVLLWFCFQPQVLNSQNQTCNSNDMKALQDFMKGLESGISGWLINNSSSDCCTWDGVVCDSSRVIGLNLTRQRLKGNLSQSLAALDQLKTLNLSRNLLGGSIPEKLFTLQNLQVLDLSYNKFSGSIPVEIDLLSIWVLEISENLLMGSIDAAGICKNSPQIQTINLSMNNFSGQIPAGFGNCTSLQKLYLNSNSFLGSFPEDLFRLRNLSLLHLQDNMLSGNLSEGIGNLSSLTQLDISMNRFFGILPDVFDSLGKLQQFAAHSNSFIGRIPASLSNSAALNSLNLRNNSLEGPISLNCSVMVSLTSLNIGTNKFHGPLPGSLFTCTSLRYINLARNNLDGKFPESFKNLQALSFLSLSNTRFQNISASLRVLQQCKNLTTLVLTGNFHDEEMPVDENLRFDNLRALIIPNCRLTGLIPQWLNNCTKLELLDLSWNRLNGTIPPWLGSLEFLFYVDLSNNSLSGEIPKSFTQLKSLIIGNISFEGPSPDFPFFVKPNPSAGGLRYNQIWSFPPSLDLGYNLLTGPIWPEFGNLKKLNVLDLSCNSFMGTIPTELSKMTSLENLNLSHNNLSGVIPHSLGNLTFLSKFSVSYNRLSGRIPTGGQFLTFTNSSFEGNNGLCGEHYTPCFSDRIPPVFFTKPGRNKRITVGMAVGIGLGTVFLLTLAFLIVLRTCSRRPDNHTKDNGDATSKNLEHMGSRLVVLFQNKENYKELCIDDLLKSTNNFDQANIIGCGGFGLVYKATLPDGRKVAIKRLSGEFGQIEREFQAEVETLSRAQHGNLVLLQGYCRYGDDRLLIYSFMENGSLDYWLHENINGASSLDWDTRLRIAQGAAMGLAYLHLSCQPHILHRDIKSSNILLDENFEAHLADFGLARLILPYDTHVTTDLVGTLGYIPPEYGQASVATYKGDVYSFGVVLLELLTGKRPMDMCKPRGCRDLISWVFQMKKEKRETEVFDPFIYDKHHDKEMLRALEIACLCLSESPKIRPSMQQIVPWLNNINLNSELA